MSSSSSAEPSFNATAVQNDLSLPPSSSPPPPPSSLSSSSSSSTSPSPRLPQASDFASWAYQPKDFFHFEILAESKKSRARVGRIHTPHGVIDTPAFVPVATNAAIKGVDWRDLDKTGLQLVFCNTYHLLLHPGPDIVHGAGGLHEFTKRREGGPFITDSGGFQVFSLAYGGVTEELSSKGELKRSAPKNRKNWRQDVMGENAVQVSKDGVLFRSYRDGSSVFLTPESTVQAQKLLGADIIIPLDELPPYHVTRNLLEESVHRTHQWEARSLQEHLRNVQNQAMYAVLHGGVDFELRKQSIDYLTSLPFDGYAIGGSLGKGRLEMQQLLSRIMPLLDNDDRRRHKPRHLLGIGDEENLHRCIPMGIDTLDSCYPTRLGRHGTLLTRQGRIRIQRGRYARAFGQAIDDDCQCPTCQHYDRAYLCHLFKAKEPVAVELATIHNLHYMGRFMAQKRRDILEGRI